MHLPMFYHDHLSLAVASGIFLPLVSLGDDFSHCYRFAKQINLYVRCCAIVVKMHNDRIFITSNSFKSRIIL
jgi:hypothetical protein